MDGSKRATATGKQPIVNGVNLATPGGGVARPGRRAHEWDSPAYEVLGHHGLLHTDWRVANMEQLDCRPGNTTPMKNLLRKALSPLTIVLPWFFKYAEVPAGGIVKMQDGRGGFAFLGNKGKRQGVHFYCDLFYRIEKRPVLLNKAERQDSTLTPVVVHNGDAWIVVIPQGFVGLAMDMGQPVLLPPGMHQWKSSTMMFEKCIDLNQACISLGPYTLLTVDKGYEAVTQNNGAQQVLPGGAVHLLTHRNWKFEKFMPTKIQTDDLQRIAVMTGDNVLMHVDATVCWSIVNVQCCAERAAETMSHGNKNVESLQKLRNDVLKQAEASLSALVGKVNFSETFSAATAIQVGSTSTLPSTSRAPAEKVDTAALLFNVDKLRDSVSHANEMTTKYGVEVLSINIISAKPADSALMQSLAKGAVAAAEAQQLETTARGRAKAATIEAEGQASALKISAQADADAEVTRAQGSKSAAKLLNEEAVAVQLATIGATGEALSRAKSNLILGTEDASKLGNLLLPAPK